MKLYHGTNTDFSEIDLAKSFPLKDRKVFPAKRLRTRLLLDDNT